MTHYAQTGKSRDPKYSKIAGTTLDRLCYNMQAAVSHLIYQRSRAEKYQLEMFVSRERPGRRRTGSETICQP